VNAEGGLMLVSILITFLVVILVLYLINLLPIDGRAKQIARVVVIILGVISLLRYISIEGVFQRSGDRFASRERVNPKI
jgi:Na+/melibiose symporter-like transporter